MRTLDLRLRVTMSPYPRTNLTYQLGHMSSSTAFWLQASSLVHGRLVEGRVCRRLVTRFASCIVVNWGTNLAGERPSAEPRTSNIFSLSVLGGEEHEPLASSGKIETDPNTRTDLSRIRRRTLPRSAQTLLSILLLP